MYLVGKMGNGKENYFLTRLTFCEDGVFFPNWEENEKESGHKMENYPSILLLPSTLVSSFSLFSFFLFFFFVNVIYFISYNLLIIYIYIYIYNKVMRVNLYKYHFLFFHFSSQLNKKVSISPLFHHSN